MIMTLDKMSETVVPTFFFFFNELFEMIRTLSDHNEEIEPDLEWTLFKNSKNNKNHDTPNILSQLHLPSMIYKCYAGITSHNVTFYFFFSCSRYDLEWVGGWVGGWGWQMGHPPTFLTMKIEKATFPQHQ